MRKPILLFAFSAIMLPIIASNEATGQPAMSYLDFGQFRNVVESEQIGLWTKLKWAGMKYVDAPNANRIVSIYEYDADTISENDCTDDPRPANRALLVNWAIHSEKLPTAGVLQNLSQGKDWITAEQLEEWVKAGQLGETYDASEFEPVWNEFWFANTCHLLDTVDNVGSPGLSWQPIQDDRLRWIVENGPAKMQPKVIVPAKLFETKPADHYFAECISGPEGPEGPDNLCNDTAGLF